MDKNPEQAFIDILTEAGKIASRMNVDRYNTYHLLLAIMRKDHSLREYLEDHEVSFNKLLLHASDEFNPERFIGQLLGRARSMANTANIPRQPMHLFYTILSYGEESHAKRILREFCDPDLLMREIINKKWHRNPPNMVTEQNEKPEKKEKTLLEIFGTDYTQKAKDGKIKAVIGRDKEVQAVIEILARKDPDNRDEEAINNAVLLGEAGTGKTAIAKDIALRIARKDESVKLFHDHRLIYLPLGSLQAGAGIRGSLEAKIEGILKECAEGPPTILFMDELHIIMGLGQSEGSSGLQEILKPVLAEGLSCIGATTTEEWRRDIESKNSAFARRWITVVVEEPNEEDTMKILQGCADNLARAHLVHFSDDVLLESIKLGRKFIQEQASPAREIETILHGVGSKTKLDSRIIAQNDDVAKIISDIKGIPILQSAEEKRMILNTYEILSENIIGQEPSIRKLSDAIISWKSGTGDTEKPLVILSLGPTGTGKTLSAEIVAKKFMHGRMIRLDMSEYMEKHSVSRLIGAPPGYVGYDQAGQLTEAIRKKGVAVVLLDEIEKAHPAVLNIFLQLFDKGRITDGQGRLANGKNCIFIMTSNLGANCFAKSKKTSIGFGSNIDSATVALSYEDSRNAVIKEVKNFFSPEFYNRIDETLVYQFLNADVVRNIAGIILNKQKKRYEKNQRFTLQWDDTIIDYLVRTGHNVNLGARPMKRQVEQKIVQLLARPIIAEEVKASDVIKLSLENDNIIWRKVNS